jgi:prevent-host-death family protein
MVNVSVARTQFSRLLELVARGEEVIITRNGKPAARLAPLAPVERPLGFVQAHVHDSFFEPLPAVELEAWGESKA